MTLQTVVPIGDHPEDEVQHQGLGRRLLEEAWRVAIEELGLRRVLIIAGPGVKPYYRRLGYADHGPYLVRTRSSPS